MWGVVAGPISSACALARTRLAQKVASLREPGTLEKVTGAVKAGYIGTVTTPLKSVIGNAANSARLLGANPVHAGADYLLSIGRSIKAGSPTLRPDEFRQVRLALGKDVGPSLAESFSKGLTPLKTAWSDGVKAFSQDGVGLRKAVEKFSESLNTHLDAENLNRALEQTRTTYKSPFADAIVNGVYGVQEAVDRPFWRANYDFSNRVQALVMAGKKGGRLAGESLEQAAQRWAENPTEEMATRALADANYATFKNKTLLGDLAGHAKAGIRSMAESPVKAETEYGRAAEKTARAGAKGLHFLVDTQVLPFTGVPSSIAMQSIEVTPGLNLATLLMNKNPANTARMLTDAGIGAALMKVGHDLYADGRLTFGRPTSPAEAAQFDAEGKLPYAVKIGDKWFGGGWVGPVAAPLYAGAGIARESELHRDKGLVENLPGALGKVAGMQTNQTYLQGLSQYMDAAKGEGSPERLVGNLVTSPIPNVVKQVARATDATERDQRGIVAQVETALPGLSHLAPGKITPFGETMERTGAERVASVLSPAPMRQADESPVMQELSRLRVFVGSPGTRVTIKGKEEGRTQDEIRSMNQEFGPGLKDEFQSVMQKPYYAALADDVKKKLLQDIIDRYRAGESRMDRARRSQP